MCLTDTKVKWGIHTGKKYGGQDFYDDDFVILKTSPYLNE